MECKTFDTISENGEIVRRPKKQFNTLDEAIKIAKIENAKPNHIHKVVAYKFTECHKYHIGRNGKEISEKERAKLKQEISMSIKLEEKKKEYFYKNLKVIGYIDLSKIK